MSKERILIRKAEEKDLEDLYRIEIECFREEAFPLFYMRKFIRDPEFITLVAISSDKIVGFIVSSIEMFRGILVGHIYSICLLYTSPSPRD